jgi:hypothetical protein
MSILNGLLDKAESILQGEPARIIGYGAAVAIYLVAKISGSIADQTPEQALVSAGAGITAVIGVIESIRHFVYSVPTVQAIATSAAQTGDDTIPPPPASSEEVATDVAPDGGETV